MADDKTATETVPDAAAVRNAMRNCYHVMPETAKVLDTAFEHMTRRIEALQSADPFRALVLSLAESMAESNNLNREIRHSILKPLVEAEVAKQARLLSEAQQAEKQTTARSQLYTPQVAVVSIGAISSVIGTLVAWLLKKDA
jgi:hypothetical protein